jgi:predicted small metal-binding protein
VRAATGRVAESLPEPEDEPMQEKAPDTRLLVVKCECGFEVRGPEDEIVPAVQKHGRELHNMDATREQVLAMARPG